MPRSLTLFTGQWADLPIEKLAKTTPPVICDNDVQAFYEIARSRWSTGGEIVL